jgi:hypothetical protein
VPRVRSGEGGGHALANPPQHPECDRRPGTPASGTGGCGGGRLRPFHFGGRAAPAVAAGGARVMAAVKITNIAVSAGRRSGHRGVARRDHADLHDKSPLNGGSVTATVEAVTLSLPAAGSDLVAAQRARTWRRCGSQPGLPSAVRSRGAAQWIPIDSPAINVGTMSGTMSWTGHGSGCRDSTVSGCSSVHRGHHGERPHGRRRR